MKEIKSEVLIIGAGLTGLSLAYFLKANQINATIVEARSRLGGRILTEQSKGTPPIELGATWLSKEHVNSLDLLRELGLEVFDQVLGQNAIYEAFSTAPFQIIKLPDQEATSKRVLGGTQKLITTLASKIDSSNIYLDQVVESISKIGAEILVETNTTIFKSRVVVSTLPALLFQKQIKVQPELPVEFHKIANQTHTWMGESIKVSFSYESRFWGKNNISGTIFSNVGPVSEMYDQSDSENKHYALTGFLNGAYRSVSCEERKNLVLNQLLKYYGDQAAAFSNYKELVWKNEEFTSVDSAESIFPHQYNGHAIYQQGYLEDSLFIAGTETSVVHGGYMEGAINSARKVCSILTQSKIVYK